MSSAAENLRKNAERFRKQPVGTAKGLVAEEAVDSAEQPAPVSAQNQRAGLQDPVVAPRKKNIRRTVDLSPDQHDRLEIWQRQTARQLGRARVSGQEVLSTLVDRLLEDDDLAREIRAKIHAKK